MGLIYLDHHATTPIDPAVLAAMMPYLTEHFGNAGSVHRAGLTASVAVEGARAQVASLIGAEPEEIVFTSGATEANNLAILGVAMAAGQGHLITTTVEHSAVLDPMAHAERYGFEVTRVEVSATGRVDPGAIEQALRPDTVLISVMAANNEIGTLQPIAEVAAIARGAGVPLHVDAAQAIGRVPIDVEDLGIDLLSLTAHKIYGPKGIGALYRRSGRPLISLVPLTFGGGQEHGLRPGTVPVPLIVGLGEAARLAQGDLLDGTNQRLRSLRDHLLASLQGLGGVRLNGPPPDLRLPHNLSVQIEGLHAARLLMTLRDRVALSAGSACSSGSGRPSHVLTAIGLTKAQALSTIRAGLGRQTTPTEIDEAAAAIGEAIVRLRR